MKNLLLSLTAAATLLPAVAATPWHAPMKVRQVKAAAHATKTLNRSFAITNVKAESNDAAYRLYESFENVTENPIKAPMVYGLPEGWTSDGLIDLNNLGADGALPTCWYTTYKAYS